MDWQCAFAAADDWDDVFAVTEGVLIGAVGPIVVPVSWSELTALTCGAVTVDHLQGLSFDVAGEWQTDSNPGTAGREAVEWTPSTVSFSLTYRDHDYATGVSKAQLLFALTATDLALTYEVIGAADKTLTLANAVFEKNLQTTPSRNFTDFTLTGRCDWSDGTNLHTLSDATHKMITIA